MRTVVKKHYSCCADLSLAWLLQPECPWCCSVYDFVNSNPNPELNPNPNPNPNPELNPNPNADGTMELSLKVQMKKVWKD